MRFGIGGKNQNLRREIGARGTLPTETPSRGHHARGTLLLGQQPPLHGLNRPISERQRVMISDGRMSIAWINLRRVCRVCYFAAELGLSPTASEHNFGRRNP